MNCDQRAPTRKHREPLRTTLARFLLQVSWSRPPTRNQSHEPRCHVAAPGNARVGLRILLNAEFGGFHDDVSLSVGAGRTRQPDCQRRSPITAWAAYQRTADRGWLQQVAIASLTHI